MVSHIISHTISLKLYYIICTASYFLHLWLTLITFMVVFKCKGDAHDVRKGLIREKSRRFCIN